MTNHGKSIMKRKNYLVYILNLNLLNFLFFSVIFSVKVPFKFEQIREMLGENLRNNSVHSEQYTYLESNLSCLIK